jgi:hypothetical protein
MRNGGNWVIVPHSWECIYVHCSLLLKTCLHVHANAVPMCFLSISCSLLSGLVNANAVMCFPSISRSLRMLSGLVNHSCMPRCRLTNAIGGTLVPASDCIPKETTHVPFQSYHNCSVRNVIVGGGIRGIIPWQLPIKLWDSAWVSIIISVEALISHKFVFQNNPHVCMVSYVCRTSHPVSVSVPLIL